MDETGTRYGGTGNDLIIFRPGRVGTGNRLSGPGRYRERKCPGPTSSLHLGKSGGGQNCLISDE